MYVSKKQYKIILSIALAVVVVTGIFFVLQPKADDRYGVPVSIELGSFIEAAQARYRLDENMPQLEFQTVDGKAKLFLALQNAEYSKPKKKNLNTFPLK